MMGLLVFIGWYVAVSAIPNKVLRVLLAAKQAQLHAYLDALNAAETVEAIDQLRATFDANNAYEDRWDSILFFSAALVGTLLAIMFVVLYARTLA